MKTDILIRLLPILLMIAGCSRQNSCHTYVITDFGAKPGDSFDNAASIQKAIDKCNADGGGSVIVPAGLSFMAGPFELKSNVDLHLQPGSRILANPDEAVYSNSAFGENRGEGMMWISAKDVENLSISGTGTIDGNGVAFMGKELGDSFELKPVTDFDPRPHVLTIIGATKVNISDITIRNSAYWTIHLVGCTDVAISHISLLNNLKIRNGDGIDIDHSKKVRISGCYIESGDDCICLKNRREYEQYGPCHDITVSDCVMTSRSCAVKIGSENMDSISHVVFSNCIIRDSNRGIGIQNRDEGTVTDVTFSNMHVDCHLFSDVWWGKSEPIYITSYPRAVGNHKDAGWRFPKGATKGACGEVSRIQFINIFATSENGVFIGGDEPGKVNDILLDNVNINLVKASAYPGGVYDLRPRDGEGFLESPTFAFCLQDADAVTLRDCKATLSGFPESNYGGFIRAVDCRNVIY